MRTLARDEWTAITKKKIVTEEVFLSGRRGKLSLLYMLSLSAPVSVAEGERRVTIAREGYRWVQLALEGSRAWFTAMFNEKGEFFELYVDITGGNVLSEDGAFFEDRYLDYRVTEECVEELDKNELELAYASGTLSKEELKETLLAGEKAFSLLKEKKKEFLSFFSEAQARLFRQINA